MVPIGNGEQTPMGASAITPATGLAGAAASPKNTGISPMRGVNLSPASPHITGQKLLAVPKPVQEEDEDRAQFGSKIVAIRDVLRRIHASSDDQAISFLLMLFPRRELAQDS